MVHRFYCPGYLGMLPHYTWLVEIVGWPADANILVSSYLLKRIKD